MFLLNLNFTLSRGLISQNNRKHLYGMGGASTITGYKGESFQGDFFFSSKLRRSGLRFYVWHFNGQQRFQQLLNHQCLRRHRATAGAQILLGDWKALPHLQRVPFINVFKTYCLPAYFTTKNKNVNKLEKLHNLPAFNLLPSHPVHEWLHNVLELRLNLGPPKTNMRQMLLLKTMFAFFSSCIVEWFPRVTFLTLRVSPGSTFQKKRREIATFKTLLLGALRVKVQHNRRHAIRSRTPNVMLATAFSPPVSELWRISIYFTFPPLSGWNLTSVGEIYGGKCHSQKQQSALEKCGKITV